MNMTIPPDIFAQEHKKRSAEVNRLRDWAGSDDSKTSELADALVQLGAHRLRGHLFNQAVTDAQQALSLSVKVMASAGPLGPYTPAPAAGRVVVAAIHLATIQTQAGQIEGAELTLGSADAVRAGAGDHGLVIEPDGEPQLWEQISRARIALANGDGERASGWIGSTGRGEFFQELDRLATLAATRWALGEVAESIVAAWQGLQEYETRYLPVLLMKGIGSARAAQLGQPLVGVYSDLADRLIAVGEVETGLAFRRKLIEHLVVLTSNHRPMWRGELVAARRWLADGLLGAGLGEQAAELFSQPGVNQAPPRTLPELGDQGRVAGELTYPGEFGEAISRARAQAAASEAELVEQARARRAEQEVSLVREQVRDVGRVEEDDDELLDAEPVVVESAQQPSASAAGGPTRAQLERAARIAAHEEEIRSKQAELAAEAERTEDGLVSARARLEAARVAGDRQGGFVAAQAVVDELRSRFAVDSGTAGDLVEALKELAVAQRQNGDWWGSRKPAKEAKDLARKWLR